MLFVVEQKQQLNLMLVWMCWGTMAMRTPKGVGSGDNEYTAGWQKKSEVAKESSLDAKGPGGLQQTPG